MREREGEGGEIVREQGGRAKERKVRRGEREGKIERERGGE